MSMAVPGPSATPACAADAHTDIRSRRALIQAFTMPNVQPIAMASHSLGGSLKDIVLSCLSWILAEGQLEMCAGRGLQSVLRPVEDRSMQHGGKRAAHHSHDMMPFDPSHPHLL